MFLFFFFKQKTAYEMRISDWSSDVCSSDLGDHPCGAMTSSYTYGPGSRPTGRAAPGGCRGILQPSDAGGPPASSGLITPGQHEIGRASCRERVCQYV